MTRSEHIRALLEDYAAQRAADDADQQARIRHACSLEPEIARLQDQNRELALGAALSILAQDTAEQRQATAREMKARGNAINARIRELLKRAGLPEDELELHYRCPVCRDTGYVGDAPSRFCECFETRLRLRQYEDGSMAGLDEQNFDKFDPGIVPEQDGQRDQLVKACTLCRRYADGFPDTEYRHLLLIGAGGLGKTFLLNCIFERVTTRGFPAVRITAFRLFEAMRQQHMSIDGKFEGFSALIDVPLLLIDDLGSEPMLRNVTVEYLFMLLNERFAARRHTIIATNLTPVQLKARYGERVASRLLDRGTVACVQLKGKDLRSQ